MKLCGTHRWCLLGAGWCWAAATVSAGQDKIKAVAVGKREKWGPGIARAPCHIVAGAYLRKLNMGFG